MDRRYFRPGWIIGHLLVLVAVLVCLRLGWWQWDRTHDPDGTAQNLGYALLWPCFGGAFIYMWIRFLKLEMLKEDEEQQDFAEHERIEPGEPAVQSVQAQPASPADPGEIDPAGENTDADVTAESRSHRLARPSRGITLSVATVADDGEDDPELATYNRALAALAEKDRRRAR